MWFAESAWPTIAFLAAVSVVLFFQWQRTRRGVFLLGIALCLAHMPLFWLLETIFITPKEQVELGVLGITEAFGQQDREGTLAWISPESVGLQLLATSAMAIVNVDGMRVSDVQVSVFDNGTRATSRFRVNATLSSPLWSGSQHQPTRWEADWRMEDNQWRMTQIVELDPITGEKLNRINQILGR